MSIQDLIKNEIIIEASKESELKLVVDLLLEDKAIKKSSGDINVHWIAKKLHLPDSIITERIERIKIILLNYQDVDIDRIEDEKGTYGEK